jgi:hypothetical protein
MELRKQLTVLGLAPPFVPAQATNDAPPELEPEPLPELPDELLPSTAKHPATVPPVLAVHVQIHEEVPSAVTAEAVPTVHRLVVGALLMVAPLADPQAPSVTVVLPPLDEPPPDELVLGPELDPLDEVPPDELPLEPLPDELETARLAPQSTALPPAVPWQIQVQGPEPDTGEAVPELHRLEIGAALTVVLLAEPQMPFTAVVVAMDAEHCAEVPPPDPAQLQLNGPLPETSDAVPVVHRLPVGMLLTLVPLTDPQAPLTTTTTTPELEPLLDMLPDELPELELPVTLPPDELPVAPELEPPVVPLLDEVLPEVLLPELAPVVPLLEDVLLPLELDPATPELEPPEELPSRLCRCWICCCSCWICCSSC